MLEFGVMGIMLVNHIGENCKFKQGKVLWTELPNIVDHISIVWKIKGPYEAVISLICF